MSPLQVVVFVRRDLPPEQRTVQSVHAVVELFVTLSVNKGHHPIWQWANVDKTVIAYGVNSLERLEDLARNRLTQAYLRTFGEDVINWAYFKEPDLFNEMTAIAVGPITKEQTEKLFSGYKLL